MKMSLIQTNRSRKKVWRMGLLITIVLAAVSPSRSSVNTDFDPIRGRDPLRGWRLIRFDGNENDIERFATAEVQPPYPETAQKYRIEGTVKVRVQVNRDGKVIKVAFLQGHTVFRSVSLEAARQWQFKTPDNNDMEGTITFTFKLKS